MPQCSHNVCKTSSNRVKLCANETKMGIPSPWTRLDPVRIRACNQCTRGGKVECKNQPPSRGKDRDPSKISITGKGTVIGTRHPNKGQERKKSTGKILREKTEQRRSVPWSLPGISRIGASSPRPMVWIRLPEDINWVWVWAWMRGRRGRY